MQNLPPITWESLQTAFILHRQGAEAVLMIERGSELAREWSLLMYIAQVDLKKSFDIISYSHVASLLSRKKACFVASGCLEQQVEGQFSGCTTRPSCHWAARHSGPRGTARRSRMPFGDEILGGLGMDSRPRMKVRRRLDVPRIRGRHPSLFTKQSIPESHD